MSNNLSYRNWTSNSTQGSVPVPEPVLVLQPMAALRAAYDLGSGATKLCLARVAPAVVPGELPSLEVLFEEEAEVLLGESYKTSDDSTIDDATCAKLVTVVERFERIVSEHAAACGAPVRRAGVATAVYREATNGPALQALLEERFNIRSSVISQSEEVPESSPLSCCMNASGRAGASGGAIANANATSRGRGRGTGRHSGKGRGRVRGRGRGMGRGRGEVELEVVAEAYVEEAEAEV